MGAKTNSVDVIPDLQRKLEEFGTLAEKLVTFGISLSRILEGIVHQDIKLSARLLLNLRKSGLHLLVYRVIAHDRNTFATGAGRQSCRGLNSVFPPAGDENLGPRFTECNCNTLADAAAGPCHDGSLPPQAPCSAGGSRGRRQEERQQGLQGGAPSLCSLNILLSPAPDGRWHCRCNARPGCAVMERPSRKPRHQGHGSCGL